MKFLIVAALTASKKAHRLIYLRLQEKMEQLKSTTLIRVYLYLHLVELYRVLKSPNESPIGFAVLGTCPLYSIYFYCS